MNVNKIFDLPENIFRIVFEKSPGSLLVKANAPLFTIIAVSDAYLTITNKKREEIIGRSFTEVFPENRLNYKIEPSAISLFNKVIKDREKNDLSNYRYDVYDEATKTFKKQFWSCSNIPIFNDSNELILILNTVIDITKEVYAKEAALESQNRLVLANEAAQLATWDLTLADKTFLASPRLAEIFGHADNISIKREEMQKQINPEDLKNIVIPAYKKALEQGKYDYEVRIHLPDDTLRWIKTQGIVVYNEQKEAIRIIGTVLDITESKRDEIRKNDFIAMASHELRTPLTTLKAYIQLLTKKLVANDDVFVHNSLIKIGQQINKMTALIHSFLDLSKLEPGKLKLKLVEFEINNLIKNIVEEYQEFKNSHVIEFKPCGEIFVRADKEKIEQVIYNLLNNAFKYSDKGSLVVISCKLLDNCVQVSVKDSGIGISEKHRQKLFQRFFRVENENTKNISGFGLGLYLAHEILFRHKGNIWVESEKGQGSTFFFSLPVIAA